MRKVGAREAKTHFSRLLARVAQGERFIITWRGVPVAVLSPVKEKRKVEDVILEIEAFGERHTLGDLGVKELIEEGRT